MLYSIGIAEFHRVVSTHGQHAQLSYPDAFATEGQGQASQHGCKKTTALLVGLRG